MVSSRTACENIQICFGPITITLGQIRHVIHCPSFPTPVNASICSLPTSLPIQPLFSQHSRNDWCLFEHRYKTTDTGVRHSNWEQTDLNLRTCFEGIGDGPCLVSLLKAKRFCIMHPTTWRFHRSAAVFETNNTYSKLCHRTIADNEHRSSRTNRYERRRSQRWFVKPESGTSMLIGRLECKLVGWIYSGSGPD